MQTIAFRFESGVKRVAHISEFCEEITSIKGRCLFEPCDLYVLAESRYIDPQSTRFEANRLITTPQYFGCRLTELFAQRDKRLPQALSSLGVQTIAPQQICQLGAIVSLPWSQSKVADQSLKFATAYRYFTTVKTEQLKTTE